MEQLVRQEFSIPAWEEKIIHKQTESLRHSCLFKHVSDLDLSSSFYTKFASRDFLMQAKFYFPKAKLLIYEHQLVQSVNVTDHTKISALCDGNSRRENKLYVLYNCISK